MRSITIFRIGPRGIIVNGGEKSVFFAYLGGIKTSPVNIGSSGTEVVTKSGRVSTASVRDGAVTVSKLVRKVPFAALSELLARQLRLQIESVVCSAMESIEQPDRRALYPMT